MEKPLSIFDSVPEDRTAVDNIFRLNVTNQMRLNIMADQKANIMITVTAIVFSVTVAELDNKLLMYPLLFFAGCCIISFFSVMWEVFNAQFGLDGIVWSNFREGFCHLMVRCDVNKL